MRLDSIANSLADGHGAAPMQPALAGSSEAAGDPSRLIDVVLRGPAAVLPAVRPKYSNVMPAFGALTDSQLADLLTFVRTAFASEASPITLAQVSAVRKK